MVFLTVPFLRWKLESLLRISSPRLCQFPLTALAAEATNLLQKLSLDAKTEAIDAPAAKEKV